jgi:hypothetical protein
MLKFKTLANEINPEVNKASKTSSKCRLPQNILKVEYCSNRWSGLTQSGNKAIYTKKSK